MIAYEGAAPIDTTLIHDRRTLALLAIGIVFSSVLWAVRPDDISPLRASLGLAIVWLGCVPGLVRLFSTEPKTIPIFEVSCLFYSVTFGLSVFIFDLIWLGTHPISVYASSLEHHEDAASVSTMMMVVGGLLAYVGTFYLARRHIPAKFPHFSIPQTYEDWRLIVLAWGLIAGHLAYLFIPFIRSLPSVGQFLQPAVYVGLGLFFILWKQGKLGRFHACLVFLFVLPIILAKTLIGAFLTPVIMFALLFFFLFFYWNKRFPILLVTSCSILFFAFYPTIPAYRETLRSVQRATHFNEDINLSSASPITEKLSAFGLISFRLWAYPKPLLRGEGYYYPQTIAISHITRRITFLPLFSYVESKTPDPVDYWGGETYKPLFTSFIPRVLWPNKPEEHTGGVFGKRYGLVVPTGKTSVNLPWIIELFVNFGPVGTVLGMAVFGLLMALLNGFFNSVRMSPPEAVTGLAVFFPLVYQESNFSVMTGSLLPLTICLYLYFRIGLGLRPNWFKWFGRRKL